MEACDTQVVLAPVVTKERFAALTGLEVGVVRGMMDRGHLPTVKLGRRRLVNLCAVRVQCLAAAGYPCPCMRSC